MSMEQYHIYAPKSTEWPLKIHLDHVTTQLKILLWLPIAAKSKLLNEAYKALRDATFADIISLVHLSPSLSPASFSSVPPTPRALFPQHFYKSCSFCEKHCWSFFLVCLDMFYLTSRLQQTCHFTGKSSQVSCLGACVLLACWSPSSPPSHLSSYTSPIHCF